MNASTPTPMDTDAWIAAGQGVVQGKIENALIALTGPEQPTAGLPATGVPATGVPATGLPATGLPATGLPATGVLCRIFQDGHLRDYAVVATSRQLLLGGSSWQDALLASTAESPDNSPSPVLAHKSLLRKVVEDYYIQTNSGLKVPIELVAGFDTPLTDTWQDGLLLLLSSHPQLVAFARSHSLMADARKVRDHRLFFSGGDQREFRYLHAGLTPTTEGDPEVEYSFTLPPQLDFPGDDSHPAGVWQVRTEGDEPQLYHEGGPLLAVHNGRFPAVFLLGIAIGTSGQPNTQSGAFCHARDLIERTLILYTHN